MTSNIESASPLQFMDYDVSRYLYETYFPLPITRYNYELVRDQYTRYLKGYCIMDHYISDINGYRYRTCRIRNGHTGRSFLRYIKNNRW